MQSSRSTTYTTSRISYAYDTHSRFSHASSTLYDHGAYAPAGPSTSTNATGSTSNPTHPYSSSVWLPQPVFPVLPRLNNVHLRAAPSSAAPLSFYDASPTLALPPLRTAPEHGAPSSSRSWAQDSTGAENYPAQGRPVTRTDNDHKEKKHGCWMCHKSFDRPSTLKKHMLVHTGEKAYACETCGRRFGVASNLNRHAKRCITRPVNAARTAATSEAGTSVDHASVVTAPDASPPSPTIIASTEVSPSSASAESSSTNVESPTSADTSTKNPRARKRTSIDSTETDRAAAEAKTKRRRRAPSPSRWIPDSLRIFDLTPFTKSTPIPLLPVRPFHDIYNNEWEERDSFNEHAAATPYHPRGWAGKLPGPGLTVTDVTNISGGRLLVF